MEVEVPEQTSGCLMTADWKEKVLNLRFRNTGEEDIAFVGLVYAATNQCDLETCRVLMKTFVTEQDFGVQESVNSVLSSARSRDRQIALLEELPRLVDDTPEWAAVLLETEIKFHLASLIDIAAQASVASRRCLLTLLNKEFSDLEYPNLEMLKRSTS